MNESTPITDASINKTKMVIGILVVLAILGAVAFVLVRKNSSKNLTADTTSETSNDGNFETPEGAVVATPDTSGSDHSNPPGTTTPSTSTAPGDNTPADQLDPGRNPSSTPTRPPSVDTQTSGAVILQ